MLGALIYFELDLNLEKLWLNVVCPTLVIRGATSDILPLQALDVMRRSRPDTALIEIPDVGHAPTLLFEHETAPVIAWMEKQAV